jgi:hypothetical protein
VAGEGSVWRCGKWIDRLEDLDSECRGVRWNDCGGVGVCCVGIGEELQKVEKPTSGQKTL